MSNTRKIDTVEDIRIAISNVLARLPSTWTSTSTGAPVATTTTPAPVNTIHVEGMALPLGVENSAPTRLMVFPLGEPVGNDDRKWRFTKADLERAVEAFRARSEPMPILYDHGKDPAKGAKAAGWVDSVELMPDGLYANVRWTDQARNEIRAGEWGFRSPGWEGGEFGDGFIGAGPLNEISLVNTPAIAGMLPVAASTKPVSDQPSPTTTNDPAPPQTAGTETTMGDTQTVAAAKSKAAAFDVAGVLEAIKAKYPGSDVFGDEMLTKMVAEILSGASAPAETPTMPAAEAPAVPAFAAAKTAEDEVKTKGLTEPAKTDPAADEIKSTLETALARIKTLESQSLSGTIVTAAAEDRKPGSTLVPMAPSPGDYVGAFIDKYDQARAATHQAAIAYRSKALAEGKKVSYREATIAVSRKK